MKQILFCVMLFWTLEGIGQQNNETKIFFDKFVKAQNDHNLKGLSDLLLDSNDFLWITKGSTIWGKEEALKKFENLYKSTWSLEPEMPEFKIYNLDSSTQQIFVPIIFTIGEPGQEPKKINFLMNMILVTVKGQLKVSSILPIISSTQP